MSRTRVQNYSNRPLSFEHLVSKYFRPLNKYLCPSQIFDTSILRGVVQLNRQCESHLAISPYFFSLKLITERRDALTFDQVYWRRRSDQIPAIPCKVATARSHMLALAIVRQWTPTFPRRILLACNYSIQSKTTTKIFFTFE